MFVFYVLILSKPLFIAQYIKRLMNYYNFYLLVLYLDPRAPFLFCCDFCPEIMLPLDILTNAMSIELRRQEISVQHQTKTTYVRLNPKENTCKCKGTAFPRRTAYKP